MEIEWVSLLDDVPQIQLGFVRISIDVDFLLKDGTIVYGYMTEDDMTFYTITGRRINQKVTHWRSHRKEGSK